MASTYSALKVELLETGANSGTWGTLTNANLGDAVLGEAITGSATVNYSSAADVTLTLTDSATSQSARNLRLNITESGAGVGYVGNLILGSGCQIEKFYLIRNNGTGAKTVKNTSGTGVAVPAGKATLVYNDGTNVVDVLNSFSSAILGAENAGSIIPFYFANQAAFPSASTYHGAIAHSHADGAMYFAHSSAWVRMLDTGGPLGTPSSGTATNLTGLPLSTGVTGTLPIANGGTGTTSTTFANLTTNVTGILPVANGGTATATPALVQGTGVTITGTWPNQTINATGTGGTVTSVGGTGTVNGISLSGTVTTSGSLTLGGTLANVSLTSQVTGTLPIANGGTGTTSTTFANLTTNVTGTLPVANGGTGITSLGSGVATFLGTPSSANLASAVTDETGSGALVFATSPTLTTPVLGTPSSGTLSSCTVDGTDAVGFRNIPQNSQSTAYTLVLADAGKHIFHPVGDNNARTFTIPANSSVAYPIGTAITFINMAVANVTIAITTDTLVLSSAGTTGSRTLATNGSATCIKITSTSWLISGSGLT